MYESKILLNQARYAEAVKENMSVPVTLDNTREPITDTDYTDIVNLYNVYLDERDACTTIRLTAKVNIVSSNQIFNSVTEIVKDEGSPNCEFLNYDNKAVASTYGKDVSYMWGSDITDAVMDTQITYSGEDDKNYTYLCGIDIFNNHIMRAKTKQPTCSPEDHSKQQSSFNTISEYRCDLLGKKLYKYIPKNLGTGNGSHMHYVNTSISTWYQHRYTMDNIMSYDESLSKNLTEKDGWLGFVNKGQMTSFSTEGRNLGVSNVLNNESPNKFIQLFPGRDRYSFSPHYNKFRHRLEKNWEYCLTYPCESVSSGFTFINESLATLKIAMIDENEHDDDDVYRCTVYCVTKHGLREDDTITMYRSKDGDDSESEVIEENIVVDTIIDDYTFTVYTSEWVCGKYVSEFDEQQMTTLGISSFGGGLYIVPGARKTVQAINGYINADVDDSDHIGSQNLSFAKTVDDVQCRYYVRIFSRFPNFDFYDGIVTDSSIYEDQPGIGVPVDVYSDMRYEKQSTATKLAFSRNIYNDDIGQIVYNDDIDISHIKDNLGRPLTSLYIMFFKTNYGYKKWYADQFGCRDYEVEHSRCFGKLNCGFEFSPHIDSAIWGTGNVRAMNNVTNIYGISQVPFRTSSEEADAILYSRQNKFYGDLCCYCKGNCIEEVIQPICHRFNTAQRELGNGGYKAFAPVKHDEIVSDDYYNDKPLVFEEEVVESNGGIVTEAESGPRGGKRAPMAGAAEPVEVQSTSRFSVSRSEYDPYPTSHPEGYYYVSAYEVPIRTFSGVLSTYKPEPIPLSTIVKVSENGYDFTTTVANHFNMDSDLYVIDISANTAYLCEIENIVDLNVMRASPKARAKSKPYNIYGDFDEGFSSSFYIQEEEQIYAARAAGGGAISVDGLEIDTSNPDNYRLYAKNVYVPPYAENSVNGDGEYRWRNIVQNGFETTDGIVKEYPFTNGCLYVNTDIVLALRRQDPFGTYGLSTSSIYYGLPLLSGVQNPVEDGTAANANDAINESDIGC